MTRGNVYFIKPSGFDGPIKIGFSGKPDARLTELNAFSPFPLELIGAVPGGHSDEYFLHCCFADHHSHREWFHTSDKLLNAIAAVIGFGSVEPIKATLTPVRKFRAGRCGRLAKYRKQRVAS